jgi:hypothetical protein
MAENLRHADLSNLSVNDMSSAQREEMRRRFRDFLQNVWKSGPSAGAARAPKKVKRWMPTKRV